MLNYGFVNGNDLTSYISDDTFAFRGTWTSAGTFTAPLDVVDYNNGRWICLFTNVGQPPLGSSFWSEMALIGTISPTDPFAIANTALATANAATVLALAAAGTASQVLGIAQEALNVSQSGTNLIASGTTNGSSIPIPSGTWMMNVTGAHFGYVPASVVCTVEMPTINSLNLWATLVGRPTNNGFVVSFNGTTDASNYYLHWIARR